MRIPAKIKDVVIDVGIQIFMDVFFIRSDLSTRCLTESFSLRKLPMFVRVRFLDLLKRSEISWFHVGMCCGWFSCETKLIWIELVLYTLSNVSLGQDVRSAAM